MGQVEWETLQWVSWYNTERLYSAIGHRRHKKSRRRSMQR